MNSNRIGNNQKSKDKSRPKSGSDPIRNMKSKSIEYVEEITTCENSDDMILKNEFYDKNYNDYVIDPSLLKSKDIPQSPLKPRKAVMVKKIIPSSKARKTKVREKVLVARAFPDNAKNNFGAAHILTGGITKETVKPHAILGSLEEYKIEATRQSDIPKTAVSDEKYITYFKKEIDSPPMILKDDTVHINEKNALKNWRRQMKKRQKQQQYLMKQMSVSNPTLLMNQSDLYRSIQEERTLIDRSMPSKDYGKGYRVGSEFWKQAEKLGGDEGISITLSQTEKGMVPPIEHVGYPSSIKKEMGTDWKMTHRMKYIHYPWWKSEYLEERREHLQDVIDVLDPYDPSLDEIEVIGKSVGTDLLGNANLDDNCDKVTENEVCESTSATEKDALDAYENVIDQPIFGPSLSINGHSARWESNISSEHVGLSIRLLFESKIDGAGKENIHITNNGTTAIHYSWRKLPEYNPFDLNKGRPLKRFFFDISNGIILPGDNVHIPFIFKSPNGGIFKETWQLETLPSLCGNQKILITLRGIATEIDSYETDRRELERYLQNNQNKVMAKRILIEILASIKSPERPSTPVDNYTTEDEIFQSKNENLYFKVDTITKLKDFYVDFHPDTEWDLILSSLVADVASLDDEDERNIAYQKLNAYIKELNYPNILPAKTKHYNSCYMILCDTVDKFTVKARYLNRIFGIQDKELVIKSSEITSTKKVKKSGEFEVGSKSKVDSRSLKKDASVKSKTQIKDKGKRDIASSGRSSVYSEAESESNFDIPDTPVTRNYMEKLYVAVYESLAEMAVNLESVLSS